MDESFIKTKERLSRKLKCKIIVGGHLCDPIKFVRHEAMRHDECMGLFSPCTNKISWFSCIMRLN